MYRNDTVLYQIETFKYEQDYSIFEMEETTLFVKFLGDSPKIRVLDMLITGRELDYSISDISGQAAISRATFYRMMEELLKNKVIIPTRKFGNMQLYKLNTNNPYIKELIRLYDNLIKAEQEN